MIDIETLTLKEAREISRLFQPNNQPQPPERQPFIVGDYYCIRTVTMIDTGRVAYVTSQWIVLTEAAWIADTGRWADAIKKAEFSEVEPFPDGEVGIGIGAVIDWCKITKSPRSQK